MSEGLVQVGNFGTIPVLSGSVQVGNWASVPPFVSGASIIWPFSEQAGVVANNSAGSAYVTPNLLNAMERVLGVGGNSCFWIKNNSPTVTDNFAAGPDGVNLNASRWQSNAGGTAFATIGTFTVPSGKQVTLSVWAKSNTGANQAFQLFVTNGPNSAGDLTATTTWQRFSISGVTTAATQVAELFPNAGHTTQDILFYGWQYEQASSPSAFVAPNFPLLLGNGSGTSTFPGPTWSGHNTITVSAAASCNCNASSDVDVTATTITAYIAVKSTTSSRNSWGQMLSLSVPSGIGSFAIQSNYFNQSAQLDGTNNAWPYVAVGSLTRQFPSGNLWDQKWHIVALVGTGTDIHCYIDGLLLDSPSAAPVAGTPSVSFLLADLMLGQQSGSTLAFPCQYGYVSVYPNTVHSTAQVIQNSKAIAGAVTAAGNSGVGTGVQAGAFVFEGDSITDGVGSGLGSHPSLTGMYYGMQWINFAHSGDQIAQLTARAAQLDALIDTTRAFNVLTVNIGRNDLDHVIVSTYLASLGTYIRARVAAGWTVIVTTLLPTTGATAGPLIASANVGIRANYVSWGAVALADWGGDATILAKFNTTPYLYDGTHPTALCYSIMEGYLLTALGTISNVAAPPTYAAPTIASLSVTSGTSAGGTSTVVTGTGFQPGARFFFGSNLAIVTYANGWVQPNTSFTLTTPAGSVGAVDVTVQNLDGKQSTLTNGFTYV